MFRLIGMLCDMFTLTGTATCCVTCSPSPVPQHAVWHVHPHRYRNMLCDMFTCTGTSTCWVIFSPAPVPQHAGWYVHLHQYRNMLCGMFTLTGTATCCVTCSPSPVPQHAVWHVHPHRYLNVLGDMLILAGTLTSVSAASQTRVFVTLAWWEKEPVRSRSTACTSERTVAWHMNQGHKCSDSIPQPAAPNASPLPTAPWRWKF